MTKSHPIAIAQLNFTVGDIEGNVKKITAAAKKAAAQKAILAVFSELAITGYPPEDLVLRQGFQEAAMDAVKTLTKVTAKLSTALLVGGIWAEKGKLYNTAFLIYRGKLMAKQYKHMLPNYGVFDEKRIFTTGPVPKPITFGNLKLGIMICEDMWSETVPKALKGADIGIVLNASPYEIGKEKLREAKAQKATQAFGRPLIYVNQVGGQDELVFDGQSFVMLCSGKIRHQLAAFDEELSIVSWHHDKKEGWIFDSRREVETLSETEATYRALVLGLKDYVEKNHFPGVILGLSGGIDSALTAAIAVDALGAKRVHAVMMPSRFTSRDSLEDAEKCAKLLDISLETISIEAAYKTMEKELTPHFKGQKKDITEENMQSRLRGLILMALSNKLGFMVVSTGNKSELSTGYATLYGDMCGGYAVLKDVYKTTVYALSNWRNKQGRIMPERVITKAPTAELRENQKDQDSLPPYEELDAILHALIERDLSVEETVEEGFKKATVQKVAAMLFRAEYKRRQAPPGVKITSKSFGRDRRYPITNGYKG